MNKIEILAPAGSMDSLIAAVRKGANAVYLGAEHYSARSSAKNFNKEELAQAVKYCHIRDVKAYLTVNTLIHDDELKSVTELISYAASIGIDAIIIQDIGLATLIQKAIPSLRLHASTQMTVHTPMGAKFLYDMGYKRVVLSRELSKNEIKEISASCPIEPEVFVHGALCMCVSGQCYLSAMLGSRSGNRGACAQPCRLPFAVKNGTGYDLSLKDLSLIHHIDELEKAGVVSAKIEGRMKRPEYVATAVDCIKDTINQGYVSNDKINTLNAVFSRQGFTDGYFTENLGRDMFGTRTKEDVVSATNDIFSKIRQGYKDETKIVPVNFMLTVKSGQPATLTITDNKNNTITVNGNIPEIALNIPLSAERCKLQLNKTGGTPFYVQKSDCIIDNGLSLPISEINNLRKNALEALEKKRGEIKQIQINEFEFPQPSKIKTVSKPKQRARFTNTDIPPQLKNLELIYIPLTTPESEIKRLINEGFNIAFEIPRCMFGKEKLAVELLKRGKKCGIKDVLVSNIGAVPLAKEFGMTMHGGFGLNLTNTASLIWAEKNGFADVELSFELTVSQINSLGGNIPRGIVAYGYLPLMITRNCPIKNAGNVCHNCKTAQFITDRKGIKFPIQCNFGCSELLNSVPLQMGDRLKEFNNISFTMHRFSVENSVEIFESFEVFNSQKKPTNSFTRGLYYRGVE